MVLCFLKEGPEKRKLSEGKEDSFLDKRSWLYLGCARGRLRPRAAAVVVVVFDEAALVVVLVICSLLYVDIGILFDKISTSNYLLTFFG